MSVEVEVAAGPSIILDVQAAIGDGESGGAGVTDHGDLDGLDGDDHTQYALADGSRGAFAASGHNHTGTYDPAGTAASAVSSHDADTSVHGIANTADLVLTTDSRLSDARTPTTHSHTGTDISDLDAGDTTSGVFGTARLASTGTADGTTFLRGDQVWATPKRYMTIALGATNQASATDGQTVYWGVAYGAAPQTSYTAFVAWYVPFACTVVRASFTLHAGTAGTDESWSAYLRLNNTSDTLVETLTESASVRTFNNTGLSLALVEGDAIVVKESFPTWATNPVNVRRSGLLVVEF